MGDISSVVVGNATKASEINACITAINAEHDGDTGAHQIPNAGLKINDTDDNNSAFLLISPGSNLTVNRTLTLTTGDADRTLTISTDVTLDQNLSTASSPNFTLVGLSSSGLYIGDTNDSDYMIVKCGSDLTANRVLTFTTGDASRTVTLSGNPTLDDWFDQSVKQAASPNFTLVGLTSSGLYIGDTNDSHYMIVKCGSDLTANRVLTFTTGDASRTITLAGNPSLGDWFNQSVKGTASPTFANCSLGTGELTCGSISRAADTLTIEIGGTPKISITSTGVTFANDIIVTEQAAVYTNIQASVAFAATAPDAQSTIVTAVRGFSLSDDTDNYGVFGSAGGGGGTNNIGVYGTAANATNNYPFLDSHGNYSDASEWVDVSDPEKKTLIRDLDSAEYSHFYDLLDNCIIKGYRMKVETEGLNKASDAREKFGLLANDPILPSFLPGKDKKGIGSRSIASYLIVVCQHQKALIKQLEARIQTLEAA